MKRKGHGGHSADPPVGGRRVRLKTLNHLIICKLCRGYLIEAATVTECLHTFCKSCIVKYLESHNTCPECSILIHHSHPLHYISLDRTLQDVVFKLVPNLLQRERERELKFYRRRGLEPPARSADDHHAPHPLPPPAPHAPSSAAASTSAPAAFDAGGDHHHLQHGNGNSQPLVAATAALSASTPTAAAARASNIADDDNRHRCGEQVSLRLLTGEPELKQIDRMFIRVSALATVTHVKKFIALQVFDDVSRFREIDITCENQLLGKDHSLKFVVVTRAARTQPLTLHYCMKLQF